jgi:hypothetical protein
VILIGCTIAQIVDLSNAYQEKEKPSPDKQETVDIEEIRPVSCLEGIASVKALIKLVAVD